MTNEEIVSCIKRTTGDLRKEYLELLYSQNEGLIRSIASRYLSVSEMDDLMQEGFIGLLCAVDGYDASQSVSFASYAYQWIRQAVSRYARSNRTIRIPESQLNLIIRYRDIESAFLIKYNRAPSDSEITSLLHISGTQLNRLKTDELCYHIRSTDEALPTDDGMITLEDTIADQEDRYTHILDEEYTRQIALVLWSVVDALEEDEAQLIRNRYQHNMTISDAGKVIGLSPEKATSCHNRALKALRKSSDIKRIYFLDGLLSKSYHKGGLSYFAHSGKSSTEDAGMRLYEYSRL